MFHFSYLFDPSIGTIYHFASENQGISSCKPAFWYTGTNLCMYALYCLVEILNGHLNQPGHKHTDSQSKYGNGIIKKIIDCIKFHIKMNEYKNYL